MEIQMASVKKKIIKNTIANTILKFWQYIIGFFMFPFIVYHVGVEDYGLYLLVGAFVGYFGLLDFGVSGALVKYVAEFSAKEDQDKVSKIINSSFAFYLGVGLIICVSTIILGTFYVDFFMISSGDIAKARLIAYLMAIGALTSWPLKSFNSIIQGLQRYDINAIISCITATLTAITTIIVLLMGYGIVEIILIGIIVGAFGQVAISWAVQNQLSFLKISSKDMDFTTMKKIFTFSSVLFLSQIIGFLMFGLDRFVLAIFVSVSAITYYAVAKKLFDLVTTVTYLPQSALLPAATELEAKDEQDRLEKLAIRASKYYCAMALSTSTIIFILAEYILLFWMGKDFTDMAQATQVFLSFIFFSAYGGVLNTFLLAKEQYKPLLIMLLFVAIMNLILSIILVQYYGILGVVLGTAIPNIMTAPFFTRYMLNVLKIDIKRYLKGVILQTYTPTIILSILLYLIVSLYPPNNILMVAIFGILSYLLYFSLFYLIGLNLEERNDLKKLFLHH